MMMMIKEAMWKKRVFLFLNSLSSLKSEREAKIMTVTRQTHVMSAASFFFLLIIIAEQLQLYATLTNKI